MESDDRSLVVGLSNSAPSNTDNTESVKISSEIRKIKKRLEKTELQIKYLMREVSA